MKRRIRATANEYVRMEAKRASVPMWLIAERLGVSEGTILRWMRKELPEEKRDAILAVIWQIQGEDTKQDGGEQIEHSGFTTESAE